MIKMACTSKEFPKILMVGKGVVGSALGKRISEVGFDVRYEDPTLDLREFKEREYYEFIHITIPFTSRAKYIEDISQYITNRQKIIIHSTIVPDLIGDLQAYCNEVDLYCNLYYSPIRCTDARMYEELPAIIPLYSPIYQHPTAEGYDYFKSYYQYLNFPTPFLFKDPKALVLGKLVSTTWYTMNITYCNMIKNLCNDKNIDFDEAYTTFNSFSRIGHVYTNGVADRMMERPIFSPGVIGGHCCMQNSKLMKENELIDPKFYKWIELTNKKMKELEKK